MIQNFCSEEAKQIKLPLYGTAVGEVQVWLALEYRKQWGVKALQESTLPDVVKEYLQSAEVTIPHSRVQLIKQGNDAQENEQELSFYVALTECKNPRIYHFRLPNYEALTELDISKMIAGDSQYDTHLHDEPLFLVCTNGKRDRCCAKWGLPVYQAMAVHAGSQAWETTHIGGHRYAATMVCLPHGTCYGYLEPSDAVPLIDAYQKDEIWQLDRYRGCTHYDGVTQAAEYFLRRETGKPALNCFRWLGTTEHTKKISVDSSTDLQRWQIEFEGNDLNGRHNHQLEISTSMSSVAYPASCDKAAKPVVEYTFENIYTYPIV